MQTKRIAVPMLAALMLAAVATTAAAAPPMPAPKGVEVEITETQPGKQPSVTRMLVPVTPGRESTMKVRSEPTRTHVSTSVRAGQAGGWIVELHIDQAPNDLSVMGVATLRIGSREVVSTFDKPDGSRTEIAMTLR